MDLSPETWVGIILFATVIGGGIMFWGTSPGKKKKLRLVNKKK